jgi:hypothetical protein
VNLGNAIPAREVLYGLCNVVLFYVLMRMAPNSEDDDPLAKLKEKVAHETQKHLDAVLKTETAQGSRTAPGLDLILGNVKRKVEKDVQDGDDDDDDDDDVQGYVGRAFINESVIEWYLEKIQRNYEDWVPIRRPPHAAPIPWPSLPTLEKNSDGAAVV